MKQTTSASHPIWHSLRTQVALAFAFLSLLLTLAVSLIVRDLANPVITRQVEISLINTASGVRHELDRAMADYYTSIRVEAEMEPLENPRADPFLRRKKINLLAATRKHISWAGFMDLDGTVRQSKDGVLEGVNVASRPWFANALRGIHVTDLHEAKLLQSILAKATDEPMRFVDFAFPVRDARGENTSVIGAHVSWQFAEDLVRDMRRVNFRVKGMEVLVVDAAGKVLLGPPGVAGTQLRLPGLVAAQDANEHVSLDTWPDGLRYLSAFSATRGSTDYPGLGWVTLVRQEAELAYEPVTRLNRKILWYGIILVVLASLAGWMVADWLVRPLMQLTRIAGQIRQGDVAAAFPARTRSLETDRLSGALQDMYAVLVSHEAELRANNQLLEARVQERTTALAEAGAELERERERLAYSLDGSRIAAWDADLATGTVWLSTEWSRMLGLPEGDTVSSFPDLADGVPDDERELVTRLLWRVLKGESAHYDVEHRVRRQDGTYLWIRSRAKVTARDGTGRALRMCGTNSDISRRKAAEAELRESETQLRLISDHVPSIICQLDLAGRIQYANQRYNEFYGLTGDAAIGKYVRDVAGTAAQAVFDSHVPRLREGNTVVYDRLAQTYAGAQVQLEVHLVPRVDADGQVRSVYAMINDITARKQVEALLTQQAMTDNLTGLPNRRLLDDRISHAIMQSSRDGTGVAVLYLDLDGFKPVNDTLGHAAGDLLLKEVATRLASCIRGSDTVARVGGDEFVLLLGDCSLPGAAEAVAGKVIEALQTPVALPQGNAQVSCSIGIAMYPADGQDSTGLLKRADTAMYEAKRGGKNRFVTANTSSAAG